MSTTPTEPRPIPSDARLVWMASERAAPLFRTLDRTRAFDPLVVLLVVMPTVVVMFAATCSAWDAALALLALDAIGVPLPVEAQPAVRTLVPDGSVQPTALWLAALGLRLIGTSWPLGIMTISLLGGVILMGCLWLFSQAFAGRRLAFWAVLLAAFHPALIGVLICPVPISLGLACTVAALWGHLQLVERNRWSALQLFAVILSIALSLLVVGPIAMVGAVVLFVDAVLTWLFTPAANGQARPARSARPPAQLCALRLLAAGGGVGLWLMLNGLVPAHYLIVPAGRPTELIEPVGLLNQPELRIGPLWGLAAIGVGRLFRLSYRRGGHRGGRVHPRLVLIWLVVGGGLLLWIPRSSEAQFETSWRYAMACASIPMLIAAAFAIEEAARRAISGAWLLLAIILPLSVRLGDLMAMVSINSPLIWFLFAVAVICTGWLLLLVLRAIVPVSAQRRGLLMGAVLLAIGIAAADGIHRAFREEWYENRTASLMARLRDMRPRDGVVLLTNSPPPVNLVFALRGVFADVPMEIAPTWDEAVNHLSRRGEGDVRRLLAAAWGMGDAIGAASPEALRATGQPLIFKNKSLLLYVSDGARAVVPNNVRLETDVTERGDPLLVRESPLGRSEWDE